MKNFQFLSPESWLVEEKEYCDKILLFKFLYISFWQNFAQEYFLGIAVKLAF
jgi:hypothetical protein